MIFLASCGGSSGFIGIGLKAKFQERVASYPPQSASRKISRQTSFVEVDLRSNRNAIQKTSLHAIPASLRASVPALAQSLFSYGGNVPLAQAFALNVFLFVGLRKKLLKMLTTEGFFHALALATGLGLRSAGGDG